MNATSRMHRLVHSTARPGVSLAECLVALALGSLVCACIAGVVATQCRLLQAMSAQSADAEAMRVVQGVLDADTRALAAADIRRAAGDSLATRLFRGIGVPCARIGADLLVRYRGFRSPAPGKDSLVLVLPGGDAATSIAEAELGACAGQAHDDEDVVRLKSVLDEPALVLLFESGTYYVRDRAFRYRLGAEGRQPITDERFTTTRQTIGLDPGGAMLSVQVTWPHRRFADTVRIRLANAQ